VNKSVILVFVILFQAGIGFAEDWQIKGFTPEMNETSEKVFISLEENTQDTQTPATINNKKEQNLKWLMSNETFKESEKNWIGEKTEVEPEESLNLNIKEYLMGLLSKSLPPAVTPKAEDKIKKPR